VSLAARADRVTSNVTPIRPSTDVDEEFLLPSRDDVRDIVERVRDRLSEVSDRATMSDDRLRALVESNVATVMSLPEVASNIDDPIRMHAAALDELLGFGPLQDLLDDPKISEIMVNGLDGVYIETNGMLRRTNRSFDSTEQLLRVIERMVRTSGRRVDQSSPMVDARLPDGSRLNVILPPLAVDGPSITIRKFTAGHLRLDDLVEQGSLSAEAADFLRSAVASKADVLVSGGTGTGKTTILNILSSFIGRHERVVTVEDAVELSLDLPNLIRLETRPANAEGAGGVTIRDLVRNSLRMRPDRIVVGEVRGAEALDMLQAMNTGHEGSLSTVHANSPRDALRRLETMVLLGGVDLPLRAIREQIASAIDVVVQLTRDPAGHRFVSSITEVVGMESDVVSTADLFVRSTPSHESPLVSSGVTSHRLNGARA
jgi:pilus assembly protein CpaF